MPAHEAPQSQETAAARRSRRTDEGRREAARRVALRLQSHSSATVAPPTIRPVIAADLAARLLAGDRRALARAISLVEDGDPAGPEVVRAVFPRTGHASVVGFTGPPGAGKSTLLGALVSHRRAAGRRVAVLSVDPSSPLTRGALLGDRIRLREHFLDPDVFIRSMASRGALGGLAEAALQATLLMDAAGADEVLLETVGVGQAEVDVAGLADTVVLVLMPGSGDSVQALKAGVMEIPDVLVVNKADQPRADALVADIRGVFALAPEPERPIPIVRTQATSGAGIAELAGELAAQRAALEASGELTERRRRNLHAEVLGLATLRWRERLRRALDARPDLGTVLDEVSARRLDPASAAERLLEELIPALSGRAREDGGSSHRDGGS